MKKIMTKILLCLCACFCVLASGCSKEDTEVQDTEYTLIQNAVYATPSNPTQEQIKVYNELSQVLNENGDAQRVAELVAVNFAYQFFTLYQKSGKEDIGGLMFLPEEEQEAFRAYAMMHYYNNYQAVITQYSKEDLPNVILHEVNDIHEEQLPYGQLMYDGFIVQLTLKYADSKLPVDGLKSTMSVQVINLDGVYRVIAVEDGAN